MGKGPAILRIGRLQKERPLSVIQGSRGATILVGMPGFVVGAHDIVAGELWLYVETTRRCGRLFGVWHSSDRSWSGSHRGA